jgi:hypothetical protein
MKVGKTTEDRRKDRKKQKKTESGMTFNDMANVKFYKNQLALKLHSHPVMNVVIPLAYLSMLD